VVGCCWKFLVGEVEEGAVGLCGCFVIVGLSEHDSGEVALDLGVELLW
jgi:hypothetical protein